MTQAQPPNAGTTTPSVGFPQLPGQQYAGPIPGIIDISDFSPGIFGSWVSNASSAPDGAAQIADTWGCVASPTGGLQPAPRIIQQMKQELPDGVLSNNDPNIHVLAFRNLSPIVSSEVTVRTRHPLFPDKPVITFSWHYFFSSSFWGERIKTRVYGGPYYSNPDTYPWSVQNNALAFNFNVPQAAFVYDAVNYTLTGANANDSILSYGPATLDLTRVNKSTPTSPGNIVVAMGYSSGNNLATSAVAVFPDPDALTTNGVEAVAFTSTYVSNIFCHQGRIIGIRETGIFNTLGATGVMPGEIIEYTDVNNCSVVTTTGAVFVEEDPTGYGAWVSSNASELFLIKKVGGGVVIRGDVANPTVIRLPGVASTGKAMNIPAQTPVGVVYGTNRGVWIWTGGDSAQCVSPQFDGWFWRPPEVQNRLGPYGRFSYQYPYIFAPNNYIMDTRLGSWFRVTDPTKGQLDFWDISANGNVLGVPSFYPVDSECVICSWLNLDQGASEYSWRSQPLQRTRGRIISSDEIVLMAQGHGHITLTVEGLDGESQTADFDISNDLPLAQRQHLVVMGHDLVVVVHATGLGDGPAPTINRFTLTYTETSQIPNTQ